MDLAHAEELVALAESRGLQLAGAPCSVLGETAQTLWKALRENAAKAKRHQALSAQYQRRCAGISRSR